MDPSFSSHSPPLCAVIRRTATSFTFMVITGSFILGILNRLSASAVTSMIRGPTSPARTTITPQDATQAAAKTIWIARCIDISFALESVVQRQRQNVHMIPGNNSPQEHGGVRPRIERNHIRRHDGGLEVRRVVSLIAVFRPAKYAVGQLVPRRGGHGVVPGAGLRIILRRGYQ